MVDVKAPLEGYRVLDLGRQQAGPRCAQVLARLGAEVIKVERLGGEETRYSQPWVGKQSAYWVQYNSGKKSLSIDLRTEKGKEVLRELVKVSDVLLQNFPPVQVICTFLNALVCWVLQHATTPRMSLKDRVHAQL